MRAHVYRLYDAAGSLLYVGQSVAPERRIRNHRTRQPWGSRIAGSEVSAPMPLEKALEAEWWAIRAERPAWNIRNNNGYTPPHLRPLTDEEWEVGRHAIAAAMSRVLRGEVAS